jgi:hypothetical protein
MAWAWMPLALAGGLLAARVVWLVWISNLTLSEDEAHYWEWSRRLDWSYYSKGPGVAWVIRASTELFGISEWSVRLPAAVAGAVAMLGAAQTARWAMPAGAGVRGLPALAALLTACVPAFAVASVLMTIDAPYLACWTWGGAFAALAILRRNPVGWLGLGMAVGVGFLFKYTIVLLPIGVALAWLVTRCADHTGGQAAAADTPRRAPMRPVNRSVKRSLAWLAGGAACAVVGLLPVVLWNASRGWPTVRHLLGHLGVAGGDVPQAAGGPSWSVGWTLGYVAMHLPVLGGVLILAVLALLRSGRGTPAGRAVRALWCMAAPLLLFYLVVSFFAQTEGNWSIAGACTLAVPAAWSVLDAVRSRNTFIRQVWAVTLVIGLLMILAPAMLGFLSTRRVFGDYIPIGRVTGMRQVAAEASQRLETLRTQTGHEPFVIASHYGRASLLAFYLPGRPTVWCASSELGGRRTQYDLWDETDLNNAATVASLAGRTALIFSTPRKEWAEAFASVEDTGPLASDPRPDRNTIYVGTGFVGWPAGSDDGQ